MTTRYGIFDAYITLAEAYKQKNTAPQNVSAAPYFFKYTNC